MKKILLGAAVVMMTALLTNTSYAQRREGGGRNNNRGGGRAVVARRGGGAVAPRRGPAVAWGSAHRYAYDRPVYFPSYRLYYDPTRGGYLYWNSGQWIFSSVLPAFLAGVNLAAASMSYANTLPTVGYYPQGGYVGQPVAPVVAPGLGVGLNLHIGL